MNGGGRARRATEPQIHTLLYLHMRTAGLQFQDPRNVVYFFCSETTYLRLLYNVAAPLMDSYLHIPLFGKMQTI